MGNEELSNEELEDFLNKRNKNLKQHHPLLSNTGPSPLDKLRPIIPDPSIKNESALNSLPESVKLVIPEVKFNLTFSPLFPKIGYSFSHELTSLPLSRVDLADWQYTINFLLNYCNKYNSNSEEEIIKKLSNSNYVKDLIRTFHNKKINIQKFQEILNWTKPLINLSSDNIGLLKKNILLIILYVKGVEQTFPRAKLKNDLLVKYWLKFLINHENFRSIKGCVYWNRQFNKDISENKLSAIKFFNEILLQKFKNEFYNEGLDFSWIENIKNTYINIYEDRYTKCALDDRFNFTLFSRDEMEMVVFILVFNTMITKGFPEVFNSYLQELMLAFGILPEIMLHSLEEIKSL